MLRYLLVFFSEELSQTPARTIMSRCYIKNYIFHFLIYLTGLGSFAQAKDVCYIPDAQIVGTEGYTCNHTTHFGSCCFGNDSCVEGGYVLEILGLCIGGAVRTLRSRTQDVCMLVLIVSEPKYSDRRIE